MDFYETAGLVKMFVPFYYNRENPRLCRGDSRCLTYTGVAPGLCFSILFCEGAERMRAMRMRHPYRTPALSWRDRFPHAEARG
jgi:hypothetical protein